MSKRARCFSCGVGLSLKHRPVPTTEQRLYLAIFDRQMCGKCLEKTMPAQVEPMVFEPDPEPKPVIKRRPRAKVTA